MPRIFSILRRRSKAAGRPPLPETPYAIVCPCGTLARGSRLATHQVIPCSSCGKPLFVLPRSPLPPVGDPPEQPASESASSLPRGAWRLPLLGAALALVAVIALSVILSSHPRPPGTPTLEEETIDRRIEAGRSALSRGKFQIAAQELEAARTLQGHHSDNLAPAQRRDLFQLHRQAALLADLVSEPLEDMVRQAAELWDVDDREWQAHFARRYQGKGLVLDAEIRREPGGGYQVGWDLFARDGRAKIDVGNLQLLRALPLEQPQRLLFGARLASVRLENGRVWVVRFEPDSGVLITEAGAAAACLQGRAAEPELLEVLRRQADWATQLP